MVHVLGKRVLPSLAPSILTIEIDREHEVMQSLSRVQSARGRVGPSFKLRSVHAYLTPCRS